MPKKKPAEAIVESLAIGVPPARAWDALTEPRVLGDIVMGHVEMDTRPGRPFVWQWSVWSKAAPGKHAAEWRGTILDAVPGSTLVLGGGGHTTVLTVKGEGNASLVTVVHAAEAKRTEDFRYGWADFLLKLKTLLERPAHPESTYLRLLVRATPAEVLRAWLSPAVMSKLLPGKAKIQAKKGGQFDWNWKAPRGAKDSGVFLEIEKGRSLAFTWKLAPIKPGQMATARLSEVRLAAQSTPWGALVALEHIGVPPHWRREPGGQSYARMWAHLLERLRCYFYFGKKIRAA